MLRFLLVGKNTLYCIKWSFNVITRINKRVINKGLGYSNSKIYFDFVSIRFMYGLETLDYL